MKKKPLEKIKIKNARNIIMNQHKKFDKTISVNKCFGSSNIRQKARFIAREIVKQIPNAFMICYNSSLPRN